MIDVQFFLLHLQICSQRTLSAWVIEAELQQFPARCQRPVFQSLEGNAGSQVGILYTEQLSNTFASI